MSFFPHPQESKTLWIGDIETWMDEAYLGNMFSTTGNITNVKVIRDKKTGLSLGYGFLEFNTHGAAQEVLLKYNGSVIPGTNKKLKMNWGVLTNNATKTSSATESKTATVATKGTQQNIPEHSIYVGELSPTVDEKVLVEFFSQRYQSVTSAKIIVDPVTRQSKGYGFVKFSAAEEAQAAIREMSGVLLRGRALKISQAHLKNNPAPETPNLGSINASSLMLNPLLASLTTTAFQTNPYMMGTDPSSYGGYSAQGLQATQMYQGNYAGMTGGNNFQQAQSFMNPSFGYSTMTMGGQNPQAFQSYSPQTQMMGGFPMQGTMVNGYANPGVQMTAQSNAYYQQMGYYAQPNAYQQFAGYGVQTQFLPNQQQQFGSPQFQTQQNHVFQSPNGQPTQLNFMEAFQQQDQDPLTNSHQQPQQQKAPLISLTAEVVKADDSNLNLNGFVNSFLPFLNKLETSETKIEEEKPEDSMIYNPNYIETNFKYDFLVSDKMNMII